MARPLSRVLAGGTAAALIAAPIMLAAPASAATTAEFSGATGAFALRLQVNLPEALAPLAIDLQIDPVTGTLSTQAGKAGATAQVLGSERGLLKTVLDAVEPLKGKTAASEAAPGPFRSSPLPELPAPLSSILSLGLLESSSKVTDTSSTSSASVARLGLALGDTLAEAAKPILQGIDAAQNTLINAVAAQLPAITQPLCQALPTVTDALLAPLGLNKVVLNTVCTLDLQLVGLSKDVSAALTTLGNNIFKTGIIQTEQSIVAAGGKVTSTAKASIAGLGLLGSGPLGSAGVIQSTSTATANGLAGGASASADAPVLADLSVGSLDLVNLQATLNGLVGDLGNAPLLAPLTTIVKQLLSTVNGLTKPIGVAVVALDDSNSAVALASCPTSLTGLQKGSFVDPSGECAASATRGIGVEVTLPAALTGPLNINGPFISLALSPSAAVAQAVVAEVPTEVVPPAVPGEEPPTETKRLARTGVESGVAGAAALAALGGAAYLRRRHQAAA